MATHGGELNTACRAPVFTARPRRPLVYIAAAYIFGIAFCYYYAPPKTALIFGLAAATAGTVCGFLYAAGAPARGTHPAPFVLLICAVFFAGALYAHATFSKSDPLESEMANGRGYVSGIEGRVLFAEQKDEDYRVLTVWAEGRKLLVRHYGEQGAAMNPAPDELVGRRIVLQGMLSCPDTARNPRCFDYRLYLLSQNIRLILTCERAGDIAVLENTGTPSLTDFPWRVLGALARAKAVFTERAGKTLTTEQAALFSGMMFGDKEAMDEETYELFKRNGVAHILSVSGLHIGMVYAFVSAALGRRRTKAFYWTTLILLLCYAALAGFSPSVMRAFAMIAVHIGAMLCNRRYDMLTGVLLSALIMLLLNPLALFGAGFLLSYTAVCSLSFTLPFVDRYTGFRNRLTGRPVKQRDLRRLYGLSPAALLSASMLKTLVPAAMIQVFVLPVSVWFFNCLPLMAVLINIPVIALASFIVPFGIVSLLICAAGAALPFLAPMLEPAAGVGLSSGGLLIDLMLFLTQTADRAPFASLTVPSPPLPLLLLFYAAAWYLLSDTCAMSVKRRGGLALPCVLALALLLCAASPVGKQGDAPYTFVDVGQGDCLHIRTADGRNYLMDGGGKYDYDVGKNIIAPYLLKNGVKKLDGIFVSHLHMDHFKGLTELAAVLDVGAVYVYDGNRVDTEAVTHAFADTETDGAFPADRLRFLAAGDTVLLGNSARAETLFPPGRPEDEYLREMGGDEDENRTSLIIRFENEGIRVLMTGDIGEDGEAAALSASDLSCDVLKVGHHGSRTSTSKTLLTAAKPAAAIIQVGRNSYGHPAQETLDRLAAESIPVYRNDESGAVMIRPAPGGFSVQTAGRDLPSPMLLKEREK